MSEEIADITIVNEGTIEQYQNKIDAVLDDISNATTTLKDKPRPSSELFRSLVALDHLPQPASCEEISESTGRYGTPVRVYNTNRALKEVPEFAERIERPGALLRYKITDRGRKLVQLLKLSRQPWDRESNIEIPFL